MTSHWRPPTADQPPPAAAQAAFLRLQSGEASEAEVASIRAWLVEHPDHQGAFDEARALWHGVARLEPVWSHAPQRVRPGRGRQWAGGAGLAAGLVAAILLLGPNMAPADVRTSAGEVRRITLPDGGTAWLDTDSAIDLAYTDDRREVVVRRGQAWFDVADEARPFLVRTHDTTITDIGTVFGVRRDGPDTRVFVSEGEVRVDCRASLAAVLPGAMAACTRDGLIEARPTDVEAAKGWQSGRLVFVNRPLGEVLKEIDRYAPGLMIVTLPGPVKTRRVTAFLELNQLTAGLEALAASEGLEVRRLGPMMLIDEKS